LVANPFAAKPEYLVVNACTIGHEQNGFSSSS
jgi:hypothetical protein